ncbi:MAG: PLP-dependent transferase [Planctomycetota bacterium]|nr:MAG: PLP-dependent transferase [Planctomycetota bacterium]GDY08786.1 cystathionine gamma-synthase [Planctomycetia bacterium]
MFPFMTSSQFVSRWRGADLGLPIPEERHAVSVCLPRWRDNVGYEEGDPTVTGAMQCGYPRFFFHPDTARLFAECERQLARPGECAIAFPSEPVARRCAEFVARETGALVRVGAGFDGRVHAVLMPLAARDTAKAFWQHAGEIIPSRQAVALLEGHVAADGARAKQLLRERVAELQGCSAEDVYLFPSGMAAVFTAYRLFQRLRPEQRSIQFGFPYVDNLKIQQRLSRIQAAENAVAFFPRGTESDIDEVARLAATESLLGLFVELPGNPLLGSPNIARLSELSLRQDFPLLIDDTFAACVNLDTLPAADAVATSLTKYFSGAGNVLAGSLVLNRERPYYERLKTLLAEEFEDIFYGEDAIVLERNSRDVAQRIPRINANAARLCEFLAERPEVADVFYPARVDRANYERHLRPGGGFGGLFSVVLRDAAAKTERFFDALQIPKGPNLGTSFTLCCPFTILAHYRELDFAESCGISRHLIRVSVGLEDSDWQIERFAEALRECW